MKQLLLIFFIFTVTSCTIYVPQTRVEFTDAVSQGKGMSKTETLTINKNFNKVYNKVKQKTTECLNKEVTTRMYDAQGMLHVSSSTYKTNAKKISKSKGEITMQVTHKPRPLGANIPAGGLFVFAVNIDKISKKETKVTLFGPSMGYGKIFSAFAEWSEGQNTACPKLR